MSTNPLKPTDEHGDSVAADLSALRGRVVASHDDMERLARTWGISHLEFGPSRRFSNFVTTRRLNEWVELGVARPPELAVLRAGKRLSAAEYEGTRAVNGRRERGFADPVKVSRLLAEGCTLQLLPVERFNYELAQLCNEVARAMAARVHVVAFMTPESTAGRQRHWDDTHVFAIQVEGCKRWEVASPGDPTTVTTIVELRPGDGLYVPPGVEHRAVASEGTSLHLSLTIGEPSPRALLAAWVREFSGTIVGTECLAGSRAARLEATDRWLCAMVDSLKTADREALLATAEREWIEPKPGLPRT
jgi:mannose-6-phosphate isomerase-like protein (cupin superfamily)